MRWTPKVFGPPILLSIALVLYNEYFIFIRALSTCEWPCKNRRCSETGLKAFMISDTHLLGRVNGHWLDKLKREWQMYQSFRIATWIHPPDVVFFLGDLTDEGKWAGQSLFGIYAERFKRLFGGHHKIISLAGNHDVGFHYEIRPGAIEHFQNEFRRGLIDEIRIKGQRFVMINSMALHGDGCRLCHKAEVELEKIRKRNSTDRPVVLQHFPLYRKSDAECEKIDHLHEIDLNEQYREQWDTLSKKSTWQLIHSLKPKAVFGGHTHKMCKKKWQIRRGPGFSGSFYEYTVSSFSWRNGDVPAFLLTVMDGDNVLVSSCPLPSESTQIMVYSIGTVFIIILFIFLLIRRRKYFRKQSSYSLLMLRSQENRKEN